MENTKYNAKELTDVAVGLYHALTGDKPNEALKERIGAGVEAAVKLYEIDPKLLYVLGNAAAPLIDAHFRKYDVEVKGAEAPTSRMFRSIEELFHKEK